MNNCCLEEIKAIREFVKGLLYVHSCFSPTGEVCEYEKAQDHILAYLEGLESK